MKHNGIPVYVIRKHSDILKLPTIADVGKWINTYTHPETMRVCTGTMERLIHSLVKHNTKATICNHATATGQAGIREVFKAYKQYEKYINCYVIDLLTPPDQRSHLRANSEDMQNQLFRFEVAFFDDDFERMMFIDDKLKRKTVAHKDWLDILHNVFTLGKVRGYKTIVIGDSSKFMPRNKDGSFKTVAWGVESTMRSGCGWRDIVATKHMPNTFALPKELNMRTNEDLLGGGLAAAAGDLGVFKSVCIEGERVSNLVLTYDNIMCFVYWYSMLPRKYAAHALNSFAKENQEANHKNPYNECFVKLAEVIREHKDEHKVKAFDPRGMEHELIQEAIKCEPHGILASVYYDALEKRKEAI
jgi:hypothetical protein